MKSLCLDICPKRATALALAAGHGIPVLRDYVVADGADAAAVVTESRRA